MTNLENQILELAKKHIQPEWHLGDIKPSSTGLYAMLFESNVLTIGHYSVEEDRWLIANKIEESGIVCWCPVPDPKQQMVNTDLPIYHELLAKGVDPIALRAKAEKEEKEKESKPKLKRPWDNTIKVKPEAMDLDKDIKLEIQKIKTKRKR